MIEALTAWQGKLPLIACGALLIAVIVQLVSVVYLSGQLNAERAEHAATRERLVAAVLEGGRWKALADAMDLTVMALRGSVRECLDREIQAQADAADRAAIMAGMVPVRRPGEEKNGVSVVDDATRTKVVARLNRPL